MTFQLRFYSLPPKGIEYPYLLVNYRKAKELDRRSFQHGLIDSGVSIFYQQDAEYPLGFIEKYSRFDRDNVWLVCPDYPGDYFPQPRNVERTIANVQICLENYPDTAWLPVLQSKLLSVESFRKGIRAVKGLGLDLYRERLAIGTVCKCKSLAFIKRCLRLARTEFPDAHIHAFGLTLTALQLPEAHYLNSWDSMAWTFPRKSGGHSCRNKAERVQYWYDYLERFPQEGIQTTLEEVSP